MVHTQDFGGTGGSTSSTRSAYYPIVSGSITLPEGRDCADGRKIAMMVAIRAKVSGYSGAVSPTRLRIGGATTAAFSIPGTTGVPTAFKGAKTNAWIFNGGTYPLRVFGPSGTGGGFSGSGTRFDRGGGGTTTDTGGGLSVSGTIDGQFDYALPPTLPGNLDAVVSFNGRRVTLTWSTPSDDGGSPITGYRIKCVDSAGGWTTFDVGPVNTTELSGLAGGEWYISVAALNAVTAAANTSSDFRVANQWPVVLESATTDLDGWASYGTLPANTSPLVDGALRRGSVAGATGDALIREIARTGSGSVAAAVVGIERTFTGLKSGATYRLNGKAVRLSSDAVLSRRYRWAVVSVGNGSYTSEMTSAGTPVTIPQYEFTATGTSHTVRIVSQGDGSWSTGGFLESAAFYDITLHEVPPATDYRLQDVALEASLDHHFTVACDTIGATWWVDSNGVTRFRQVPEATAIKAIFTDSREVGELEYVDLEVSYDTRNLVNAIEVRNLGRDAATGDATDFDLSTSDPSSVFAWGMRPSYAEMSMRTFYDVQNMHKCPQATGSNWADMFQAGSGVSAVAQVDGLIAPGALTLMVARYTTTSGTCNLNFTGVGSAALDVVPGKTYTVSAVIRSQVSRSTTLNIAWRQANGTTTISTSSTSAAATITNAWTDRRTITATAPTGAVKMAAYFSTASNGSGQYHYVTAVSVTEDSTSGSTYIHGDMTDGDGYSYEWLGTPDESPSRRLNWVALDQRLDEIIATLKTPQVSISSITWNAQEDTALAARLDVQDRIRVRFRGVTRDCRIVGIRETITGTRWLMTLALAPS